ncbi:DNA polymerase eta [Tanacetum coccineum]
MPVARPESSDSRIIAHVDMDCFYVQVEQRKQPELRGKPTAVVQYNSWKGGGLIAVGYEARKDGVKRSMRGDEAKEVCPEIHLVQVPVARGKADLTIYRDAGSEVVSILARKGRCERASIDEVYLDLTDAAEAMLKETPLESLESIDEEVLKSHILGLSSDGKDDIESVREWLQRKDADHRDKLLACGAILVAELRLQVLRETEFTCSAGVAHNKMLAKLASGMNKPAQQTIVTSASVKELLETLPVKKMKQLGGKLGSSLQTDLGVNTVADLLQFSEEKLQDFYGVNTGTWLWNTARGINGDEVEGRLLPKSHGSGKTFPGVRALKTVAAVEKWLKELCEELSERLQSDLEKNKRIAHTLTLHANAYKSTDTESHKKFPSKSCPLRYGAGKIIEDAANLFQAGLRDYLGSYMGNQCGGWGVTNLSVSASKIVAIPSGTSSITKYFHGRNQLNASSEALDEKSVLEGIESRPASHQIERGAEEIPVSHDLSSFDRFETACKDEASGDIAGEDFNITSGTESCSTSKQNEQQSRLPGKETKLVHSNDGIRSFNPKRKATKEKGTSSILRFLQSNSTSSSKQDSPTPLQETNSLSLGTQEQLNIESQSLNQNVQTTNAWSYKVDEIDQSVIEELPLEIQQEFRTWLRPQKRPNTVKRGSSIAHYFSPTKN